MGYYYHCVPGRIRIKLPSLQNNPRRGAEVESLLRGFTGVDSAAFSPLTGSLLVLFDPERITAAEITEALKSRGLFDESQVVPFDEHFHAAMTRAGGRIGRAMMSYALGRTLDASGLSLLAALI
jgi:hypothetical protein